MPRIEMLKDVPNSNLPTVKGNFEQEGATVYVCSSQDANHSVVFAVFDDPPTSPAAQGTKD